jgi:hypothetical protein
MIINWKLMYLLEGEENKGRGTQKECFILFIYVWLFNLPTHLTVTVQFPLLPPRQYHKEHPQTKPPCTYKNSILPDNYCWSLSTVLLIKLTYKTQLSHQLLPTLYNAQVVSSLLLTCHNYVNIILYMVLYDIYDNPVHTRSIVIYRWNFPDLMYLFQ